MWSISTLEVKVSNENKLSLLYIPGHPSYLKAMDMSPEFKIKSRQCTSSGPLQNTLSAKHRTTKSTKCHNVRSRVASPRDLVACKSVLHASSLPNLRNALHISADIGTIDHGDTGMIPVQYLGDTSSLKW